MKMYNNLKHFVACILVISALFSPLSFLITEATEGYQNLTGSYNCYAYAINRVDELDNQVRFYNNTQNGRLYQPGDISKDIYNTFGFDPNISYETMLSLIKCNVISDLYAMGHADVSLYYYDDSVDYEEGYDYYVFYNELINSTNFYTHELICFRVGPLDYHFMRYDCATESWYNKNGYDPIFKYTDNNGIPANNVAWIGANTYDSDIIYVRYNKLQINVNQSGFFNGIITVKGGVIDFNSDLYCCGYSCCNPNGICTCESEVVNKGKDAVYEIVFSTSGTYYLQLLTEAVVGNFNYKIYSYNMYNGNYQILAQGNGNSTTGVIETVNLTAYEDYNDGSENWQYQVYRYYLRLDFGKVNTSDLAVNVNVFHNHEYTDHYEQATSTYHKIYCQCGAYITEEHQMANYVCSLCGEPHEHTYGYIWKSDTKHRALCICGDRSDEPHVISINDLSGGYATCLLCGGRASFGVSWGNSTGTLPRTENGSFILPNGIIVLADEDIEAYFDGTLEFVYPDSNLETE